MRIKSHRQRKGPLAEINVVPYIDVMLVLLVIFMITTPLLTQGVNVELPKAAAKALAPKQQEPVIITVDHRGDYYLNVSEEPSQPISPNRLVNRVAAVLQLAQRHHQQRD